MSSICVHGLGYIGLPTAAMFANYDHDVVGYDTDATVVHGLQEQEVHLDEPGLRAFVTQALESGALSVSEEVVQATHHIICVPTPIDESTKEADLSSVRAAGEAIARQLRPGDSVILESTVPPGTTVSVLQPILERGGFDAGDDFALVHCPETVLPGNIINELRQNNRIIGGIDRESLETAIRLYDSFVEGEIRTATDPTMAEFIKLVQNTFRDANIALANEIAKLAADYGISSRRAIELANEHPRVDIHQPGPGVGGHCLPIDPWFLGQASDELHLIATAREVNVGMTEYVIGLLKETLGVFSEKKIAIMGLAYKGDVTDTRNSPGLALARQLQQESQPAPNTAVDGGAAEPELALTDPHVEDQSLSLSTLSDALAGADAAVIATDHEEYADLEPTLVSRAMKRPYIIDTKAVLNPDEWDRESVELVRL